MADEPATPDPVELVRQRWEAASRGEFDLPGLAEDYAADAVLDTAGYGMGTFEGREAIRGFLVDWIGSFDDLTMSADEIVGFGNGVVLSVYHQRGRPLGSSNYVRVRSAIVGLWVDGMIVRSKIYTETEIDEARAAAERLAREPG
jgi:ketosteroid isomerase-like protein